MTFGRTGLRSHNPQVWGSSPHPGTSRTSPSSPDDTSHLRQTHQGRSSRPNPTLPGPSRSPRATRGATRVCVVAPAPEDNPDLAAVVEAWPDLPEALKAGILAMVKAARS